MKKSLIAAAVAAVVAAPAFADVSISGGLQAELRSVGGDGASLPKGLYATDAGQYGNENGGSYGFLKFSASEDLGDGLKALAMWNGVINVGDAGTAGGMTGRDAYVGLAGGFGAVLAGTLSTPYKSSTVSWDPMVMTSLQARGNGGMSDAHNGYASNALAYANTFNSVKVVAAMVLDEGVDPTDGTKTNGKNAFSFSVNAPVGPVEVAVAYVDASKFSDISALGLSATKGVMDAAGVTNDKLTATKLGVKWVSGDITVAGQYEAMTLKPLLGTTEVNLNNNTTYVTASYAMGNNTISAAYGKTDWKETDTGDVTYMMVGLNHAFSKTTNAFVGYRSTDPKDLTAKETSITAGLRVAF